MVFKPYHFEHSAEIPLRTALNLRMSNGIQAPVFNGNAPRDQIFPYVIIGESVESEFGTKTSAGANLLLTMHIYTEEDGYDQIDTLKGQMLRSISGPPVTLDANWKLIWTEMDGSSKYRYDTTTAHCVVYLRFVLNYNETVN